MYQVAEELPINEQKYLANVKYSSKALLLLLVFPLSLLLLCFRELTVYQFEWWFGCFFDELVLDGVLDLV